MLLIGVIMLKWNVFLSFKFTCHLKLSPFTCICSGILLNEKFFTSMNWRWMEETKFEIYSWYVRISVKLWYLLFEGVPCIFINVYNVQSHEYPHDDTYTEYIGKNFYTQVLCTGIGTLFTVASWLWVLTDLFWKNTCAMELNLGWDPIDSSSELCRFWCWTSPCKGTVLKTSWARMKTSCVLVCLLV